MSETKTDNYIGANLDTVGQPNYYDPGNLRLKIGDKIVVKTNRGLELGTVAVPPLPCRASKDVFPVVRIATTEDLATTQRHKLQAVGAVKVIKERVYEYNLPMQILAGNITLDGNCIVIEFSSESRVDFRSLVRDLATRLHKRVELHQIGTRDRSTLLSGLGVCGQRLCCSAWLQDFSSVSIKVAKTQGIMFNPYRISGSCGRLMCCLKYEYQLYSHFTADLPCFGDCVTYAGETARVIGCNISHESIILQHPEKGIVEVPAAEAKELPIVSVYEQESAMFSHDSGFPLTDGNNKTQQ